MAYIHKFYNQLFAKTPVNSCAIVYSFLIVIYSTQAWKRVLQGVVLQKQEENKPRWKAFRKGN